MTDRSVRNLSLTSQPTSSIRPDGTETPTNASQTSLLPPQLEKQIAVNSRARKLLVDLWCMSAASFRRAGKLEEARGAIQEAERLDADDPAVWVQVSSRLVLYQVLQT